MALTKESHIDKIEVVGKWTIQVRRVDVIKEDGVQLSSSVHRWPIQPFMDWSGEDPRVVAVCDAYFTADLLAEWTALQDPDGPPFIDKDMRSPGTFMADGDEDAGEWDDDIVAEVI